MNTKTVLRSVLFPSFFVVVAGSFGVACAAPVDGSAAEAESAADTNAQAAPSSSVESPAAPKRSTGDFANLDVPDDTASGASGAAPHSGHAR